MSMDASERLGAILALQQEMSWSDAKVRCDLLLSAFVSALKSSRRASVCWPSPSHLLCTRQHQLLIAELEQLPRVPTTEADLQSTTDLQLQLLQWLFLHLQIKRDFNLMPISLAQLTAEIRAAHCWLSDLSQLDSCRCILRVDNRSSSSPHSTVITGPKLVAYHGTDFSNIHSILHNGLMAASGTRLQGTGAVFGSGVYLAQDFNVAYSFSRAREGWCGSGIGRHLRCVLLCEVDTDMAVQGGSVAVSAAVRLPEKYILAPRPQGVVVRYLLLFSDDLLLGHTAAGQQGRSRHIVVTVCMYLTVAYVLLMLLLPAWSRFSKSSSW